jgi:hypothetical protein
MKHFQPYNARNGRTQYRPAAGWLVDIIESDNSTGFCLACAETAESIEPDAEGYTCAHCGAPKVYGAEALLERGIYFDDDREADIQDARRAGFIR